MRFNGSEALVQWCVNALVQWCVNVKPGWVQAYCLRVYQMKVVNDDVAKADPTRKIEYFNKQQRKARRVIERVFGEYRGPVEPPPPPPPQTRLFWIPY